MSVEYKIGNIVEDDADLFVIPVNTVGVMGKGVALEFRNKYPEILPDYISVCNNNRLLPGKCIIFKFPSRNGYWAAFATKGHWRYPSKYEWIEKGLDDLRLIIESPKIFDNSSINSITIPPLGCGNGGLDWKIVHEMIIDSLAKDRDIRIYGTKP